MTDRIVPEAIHPGELIRDSLKARDWKQVDLAQIMGVLPPVVCDLVAGKRRITPKTAQALADAFGNDAEEWINLQTIYDRTTESIHNAEIRTRKSILWRKVPIRHAKKRGWISDSANVETLEAQVLQFYRVSTIDAINPRACAARKSTDQTTLTTEQFAWYTRARNLAESLAVRKRYSRRTFKRLLSELEPLRIRPEGVECVPKILGEHGIRFLIVEPIPGSKIDGVTFWIHGNEPVIVLSMRYDRIDWFWYTLAHELGHVYYGHGKKDTLLDTSLVGAEAQSYSDKKEDEKTADEFAERYLIDHVELQRFIDLVSPMYSDKAIRGFAKIMLVHPGIIVGRLQHMNKIAYSRGREMLVKVRNIIIDAAITDGWGHSVSM